MVTTSVRRSGRHADVPAGSFAPPRLVASLLDRASVRQRLGDALAQAHVWVHGAAGCGKSTAVALALQGRRPQPLWLQLDTMDRDVAVWFDRVAQVFGSVHSGCESSVPRYGPEHASDLERFARQFFRTMWGRWSGTRVWVLDDVHELAAEVQETMLPVLLQEAPTGLTIVLIGRAAPVPGVARAVANRQLNVVSGQDLRFSHADAAALFAREIGDRATTNQARDWCDVFEGWAAGLVAACTALQRPGFNDTQAALHGLESVALMQYLAAEGFAHLELKEQDLLMHTAFMHRFTATQAAALASCDGAQALLDDLLRHHAFLEASPPYYRVHAVFRRFLQVRWEADGARTHQRLTVMRDSASLLQADGHWLEAAELWVALGDTQAHAQLVERHAPGLLAQGRDQSVVDIIDAHPAGLEIWHDHPRVLFWLAQALSVTDAFKASAAAHAALQSSTRRDDAVGAFLAAGTLLTLFRAQRIELPDALHLAQRCESDYHQLRGTMPIPLQPYAVGSYLAALSTQHHGAAIDGSVLEALLDGLQVDANAQLRLRWLTVLHEQCYIRQEPVHVHRLESQAQTLCNHSNVRDFARVDWWLELARARVYQRRLPEADAALNQADTLLARLDDDVIRCQVHAWRLIVRIRQGRARECQGLLHSHSPWFAAIPVLVRATVHWAEGNWYLHMSQYQAALVQFDAAVQCYAIAGASPEQGPMIWLGQSVARLHLGYEDGALQSLQPLLDSGVGGVSRARLDAYALAVQVCVALRRRDAQTEDRLVRCWNALRATDYRDFMQGGESWVAELCAQALHRGIESEFVDAVVRHRQLTAPPGAPQCWPFPVRIRCLGQWTLQTEQMPATERALRTSLELLHRVLVHAPTALPIDTVIAELWPGEGREGAQKAFDAALHRLRKRLGCEEVLRLNQRQLSLHPGWVWVDVIALEQRLDAGCPPEAHRSAQIGFCEDVLDLYRGHMLSEFDSVPARARRHALWQRVYDTLEPILRQESDADDARVQPLRQRLQHLLRGAPAAS